MYKLIALLAFSLFITSCSDDKKAPTEPPIDVESMYSWLNIDAAKKYQYTKQNRQRAGKEWIDAADEYGKYTVTSDTSAFYTMHKVSDNESTFSMDLSYDSTKAYMNSFSVGDNFIDPVLEKLDFKRLKIADMNETEWSLDTLFYEDIAVDEKNTFYGYIAFKAKRVADSTVVFIGKEEISKRFELEIRIIANQVEKGYLLVVYPGYYFSFIDGVGFYRIQLKNHTNTAIAVEEFDYILDRIEK